MQQRKLWRHTFINSLGSNKQRHFLLSRTWLALPCLHVKWSLMIPILTNVQWEFPLEQPGDEVNTTEWDLLTYKKFIITELFLISTNYVLENQANIIIGIILMFYTDNYNIFSSGLASQAQAHQMEFSSPVSGGQNLISADQSFNNREPVKFIWLLLGIFPSATVSSSLSLEFISSARS